MNPLTFGQRCFLIASSVLTFAVIAFGMCN